MRWRPPARQRRARHRGSASRAGAVRAPEFWHTPPGFAAGLLLPLGSIWALAGRVRRALARPCRAAVPVICVGNLVAGGSGKTPVVLSLARLLTAAGIAVHVVTRGYGGRL